MNVPPTGIEYVNVLRVSPFILTGIGRPDVSKTSMRPASVALLLFTKATWVAQPPAIANSGMSTAVAHPTVPAAGEFAVGPAASVMDGTPEIPAATAIGSVLKTVPAKRSPITANGEALCIRKLPRKPLDITSVPNIRLFQEATIRCGFAM